MITKKYEHKTYDVTECCVFRKTKELYGGLSNMASGFPLKINGISIFSSESLYQVCRFPHLPDVQKKIIKEKSPMSAKMVSKPFRNESRSDWDDTRIKIMRWCLRIKLAQNYIEFGKLLESTLDRPIVEDSRKDDFWGAIRDKEKENMLKGTNALGRLLMELRQFYNEKRYSYEMFVVEPLNIPDFNIFGQPIGIIDERDTFISYITKETRYSEKESSKIWIPDGKEYPKIETEETIVNEHEGILYSTNKKRKLATKSKPTKSVNKFDAQTTLPF